MAYDFITEYAGLQLIADKYRAQGQPVPFDVSQNLERITMRAKANLSPQQLAIAQQHAEAAKTRILAQAKSLDQQDGIRRADKITQDLTQGVAGQRDGLTREQLKSVARGEKLRVPVKKTVINKDKVNKIVGKESKQIFGKPLTQTQYEKQLDYFVNLSPDDLDRAARKNGVKDVDSLKQQVNDWRGDRYEYEQKKRDAKRDRALPDEQELAPSDEETRRAQITEAYFENFDETDKSEWDTLEGNVTNQSLEEDNRRGDIARAMTAHEDT